MDWLRRVVRRHGERLSLLSVLIVLLAAFGPTLVGHVRLASDPFRFADDARILIPPLYRSEDPSLFPGDPVTDYYLAGLPDAPRLLYGALAPVIGPQALSKALPYVLFLGALVCLGFAARRLGGNAALLGALALALGSAHVLGRMVGGLPRAFALPLLLGGVLCLVLGRPLALAVLAVIAAAFYPVSGLLLGLSLFGFFLLPEKERGPAAAFSWRRRIAVLGLTALGMGLVVLPGVLRLRAYGPAIDASLVRGFPEAGEYGRFDPVDRPPFPALPKAMAAPLTATFVGDGTPLVSPTNLRAHGTLACFVILVVATGGFVVLAKRRVEARRLLVFVAVLVVAHTLSLFVTPRLFLPERYVAYGVPAFALLVVPAAFSFLSDHARRALRFVPLAWNVAVLALVGAHGASWSGLTVLVPPAERPLYETIAALPNESIIAGWPGYAIDNVPYLSRRTAFLTRETHMPFHVGYTALMRERMRALVAAYYAGDLAPLSRLHRRYGVTHLIVDPRDFVSPAPTFAPFDADTRAAFEHGKERGFAVLLIAPKLGRTTGGLLLVDLSPL